MIAASKEIKERYPQIPIITTARFADIGANDELAQTVDAWCPDIEVYENLWNKGKVAAARARGKEVWWYIALAPLHPYPNWLVEYPAIEAAAYGSDGLEVSAGWLHVLFLEPARPRQRQAH